MLTLITLLLEAQMAVPESLGEWCKPVTVNVTGTVSVNCVGVDPRAMDVLNAQLARAHGQLDDEIRIANEWVEKYKLLEKRFADAGALGEQSGEAQRLLHEGRFAEAGALLDRIIAQEHKSLERLANDHYNRALIYQLQFDAQNALVHLQKACAYEPDDWRYAAEYAHELGVENRMVEEEAIYRRFFLGKEVKHRDDKDMPYVTLMLIAYARFCVQRHQYENAERMYNLALEGLPSLIRKEPEKFSTNFIQVRIELGAVYVSLNRFDDADTQFDFARTILEVMRKDGYSDSLPFLAWTWREIGDEREKQERRKEAWDAWWTAAGMFKDAGGDTARFNPQIAEIFARLGKMALDMGQLEAALVCLERALNIYRELVQRNPDLYRPGLAETLDTRGAVYVEQKKYDEAKAVYEESLKLKRLYEVNMPEVGQEHIAESFNHLAALYEDTGDYVAALREVKEELEILRPLQERNKSGYLFPLVQALVNYGVISWDLKNWHETLLYATQAREMSASAVQQDPDRFAENHLKAIQLQGAAYAKLQDRGLAEKAYLDALKVCEGLAQRDHSYAMTYAEAFRVVADFYEHQGEFDKALDYAQQAVVQYRELRAQSERYASRLGEALLMQTQIMRENKMDCSRIIPLLMEADEQANSEPLKRSTQEQLRSCGAQ